MRKKLILNALLKYIFGLIIVCLLLFLPAKTLNFFNAWLFIGLLFIPMFIFGIVLLVRSPELLSKRLNAKEKENVQKVVMVISLIIFVAGFMMAGFNYYYKWSTLPLWLVIIASVILLIAYGLYIEVMRENVYLSRTVEVQENQKVIDNGLYGLVRHPMYFATLILFISIPVVLGSLISFFIFMLFIPILVIRIINEEKILEKELIGYKEYKMKIKYRLLPFIW